MKDYLDAIASYVVPGGGSDDILASINPTLQLNVSSGIFTINSILSHLESDPDPAAFADFTKMPANYTDTAFVRISRPSQTKHRRLYIAKGLIGINSSFNPIKVQQKLKKMQMAFRVYIFKSHDSRCLFNQRNLFRHLRLYACAQESQRPADYVDTADYYGGLAERCAGLGRRRY